MTPRKPIKPKALRKEITLAIIVKMILIFLIWYFCFSNPVSKHLTDAKTVAHISAISTV
ncbi:MAG: hypothetical protein P1U63_05905 [Coxiellaceae bacterium]|nr:hypothetical protein [Coxiellaceae bacterium]